MKGWNFQAHREFPGKLEPSNLSRDNVSTEIGRSGQLQAAVSALEADGFRPWSTFALRD